MQVGITVPQFREDVGPALRVTTRAEEGGLDGVFVFDHMWPLGRPDRPALYSMTLLGALAAQTSRIHVGTLVARVGLRPDAVLVHELATVQRIAGDRLIAGLGTGDVANRNENDAYGVPFEARPARVSRLTACCKELRRRGVQTWVGGASVTAREIAAEHADGWNGWGLDLDGFQAGVAHLRGLTAEGHATWGGQVLVGEDAAAAAAKLDHHGTRPGLAHGTVDDLARHLRALADAGAAWAICAPIDVGTDPATVDLVAEAAKAVR